MYNIMAKAARWLVPVGLVLARLVLDEGLTELEKLLQSVVRKGAQRFVQAYPQT